LKIEQALGTQDRPTIPGFTMICSNSCVNLKENYLGSSEEGLEDGANIASYSVSPSVALARS
jgi:hypothetical protein